VFAKGIRYKAEKEQHAEGYERYRYVIHLYPLPIPG
jgi:hypothetical protein